MIFNTLPPETSQQHTKSGFSCSSLHLPARCCNFPCTLQVGVGALVINEHGRMLAVQERNGVLKGRKVWKMPTGLVHAGEDLSEAAVSAGVMTIQGLLSFKEVIHRLEG